MANSRLERIGTIYSRITGLLRASALKPEDKPLWYDVYQQFPPKYPPKFERTVPAKDIQPIFYPEDVLRAKIHKTKSAIVGNVNLSDLSQKSNTQKCITYYNELREECNDEDEALEKAVNKVAEERPLQRETRPTLSNIADEFKKAQSKPTSINITELFKK